MLPKRFLTLETDVHPEPLKTLESRLENNVRKLKIQALIYEKNGEELNRTCRQLNKSACVLPGDDLPI